MRPRITDEGTLLFPKPPEGTPVGYVATGDPCVFLVDMPDCGYRRKKQVVTPCCGLKTYYTCSIQKKRTSRRKCNICGGKYEVR